jgi:hypothetical protein
VALVSNPIPPSHCSDLTQNKLSGGLPGTWAALTQLNELSLGENSISGTLPAAWSSMMWFNKL